MKNVSNTIKHFIFLLLAIVIFSCTKNPETYIKHIDGYWEIDEVTMADGSKKEYKFNETIDYISVNDSLKGFRKKLKPGINDTYFSSDDEEAIVLKIEDNTLNIYYNTPYANWKETVLEATETQLRIINESENIYLYKRYTPIKLDIE
ncbi:lipocalin family protein [Winogradskyella sp. Asnod2-B02-A]|uniref:lipocalin family protein n=1 Tax=Winogradskyella sp. Asnod2-B02-A TaxID=3160583 RepID=UPI00386808A1